ncbi:unnamed protein product, partial [Polarella glacialis]
VTLRHAVDEEQLRDEEVRLTVKSDATMKSVKEALAAHLGRPEILRTCRLVHRVGSAGAFAAFKDSEKINGRRNLLVLGVQSLRAAGDTGDLGGKRGADALQEEGRQLESQPSRQRASDSRSKVEVPLQLGVAQLLALQKDLLEGFSTADFQARRKELQRTLEKTDLRKFTVERQKLFLTVQSMVLPKYGLPGNPKGVFEMMQQFEKPELLMNQEFQKLGAMLNALLFSDDDAEQTKQTVSPKAKQRAVDVQVTLRHAVDEEQLRDEEVRLTVKSDASMKSVKEALAVFLGRPEILRTCRLVHLVGSNGPFAAFKDSEKINGRRNLLVIGVQSLRAAGDTGDLGDKGGENALQEEGRQLESQPSRQRASDSKSKVKVEVPLLQLGVAQLLALQKDLLEGFSTADFQARRKELQRTLGKTDLRKFTVERQKLFLTVQSMVLPKYGLPGNPKGVFEMMQQFEKPELLMNEEFQKLGAMLNALLFSDDDVEQTEKTVGTKAKQQIVDVEVTLRHAVDEEQLRDQEVRLSVKSDASMKSVKEALAVFLGRPEILRTCRLVHLVGSNGPFAAFKDSEKINGRRSLLVLGVQSLRAAGDTGDLGGKGGANALQEEGKQLESLPSRQRASDSKSKVEVPLQLGVAQLLALQKDLLEGFSTADFQARRKELQRTLGKTDLRKFTVERQKLFLTVQSMVLPKYGLPGNPKGVFEMMQQFEKPELLMNQEFQQLGSMQHSCIWASVPILDVLNALLFSDDDVEQTKQTVSTKAKQRAADVEVTLRHAVDEEQLRDEEVRLTVKSDASMKSVKEALAVFLGRP